MEFDFWTLLKAAVVAIFVLLTLSLFLPGSRKTRKKTADKSDETDDRILYTVEIGSGEKEGMATSPTVEQLEDIPAQMEAGGSGPLEEREESDIDLFRKGDLGEAKMREVLGNLILSGMEVRDINGGTVSLEEAVGQEGEAEEPATDDNVLFPVDPEPVQTREKRISGAIDRLNMKKTNPEE